MSGMPAHRLDRTDLRRALILSVVATALLFLWVDPLGHPFIDDAEIVLRYLDHFAKGYFHTYNPKDGPVFGVSGFVHGTIAGLLAYLGVRPEVALVTVNALGCLALFFALYVLGKQLTGDRRAAIALPLLVGFGTEYVGITAFLGLETPLHLAIVAWAIVAYFARSRWGYALAALAIVSKLDAIGVSAVLVAAAIARERSRAAVTEALRLFFAPLLVWTLFAIWIFGSPLPQSFVAKHYYFAKAGGSAFPYVASFFSGSVVRETALAASAVLFLLGPCLALRARCRTELLLFHALAAAVFAQYLVYSPYELMLWYHPLPEMLLRLAALAALPIWLSVRDRLEGDAMARYALHAMAALACLAFAPRLLLSYRLLHNHAWKDTIEADREVIAKRAAELTPRDRVLLTGNGYPARYFPGYVVDFSGLNSRAATRARLDIARLFDEFDAATAVVHGPLEVGLQRRRHLRLADSYYTCHITGFSAVRIFVEDERYAGYVEEVAKEAVRTDGGRTTLRIAGGNVRRLVFGVAEGAEDRSVRWSVTPPSGAPETGTCVVPAAKRPVCVEKCAAECEVPVRGGAAAGPVSIKVGAEPPIAVLSPLVERW